MIMYNTLIGAAAGTALILVPRYWAAVRGERVPLRLVRDPVDPGGWAAAFGVLGLLLTGLGFTMTVTHPLAEAKPYIDTLFGEPALLLGVLLLGAAWRISRRTGTPIDRVRLNAALAPAGVIVFVLGLVLTWCTLAILRFNVISSAPNQEPISGLLHRYPAIENTFFAVLYGLAAIGCLLFPFAGKSSRRGLWLTLYWAWTASGIGFVLFSAMNFYTHTGLVMNLTEGTAYRW
ncbi:DUF981 family protein [Actinoplanes sp. NPDC049118]|uniref:DUF981 family protein n=1 Tax=Actinoplanes sp. NPDC049118 TaxID=3155769 RepID=UPI00340B4AFC